MKRKALVVIGCVFILGILGCLAGETIKLEVPSGPKVKGFYFGTPVGWKRPGVLILPGLSGLRGYGQFYREFARWLNKEYDFNVMAVDYRGKTNEEVFRIVKERGSITFVKEEVETALDYIRKQETVAKDKIGLVGFSLGTISSIRTAARNDCVKTVVLVSLVLSPFSGGQLAYDFSRCANRPIFFFAAEEDHIPQNNSNAAENTLYWSNQFKGDTKVEIAKSSDHSAELLQSGKRKKMVGDWLQKHLI